MTEPMPFAERGRIGAHAVNSKRTPEQRLEVARHAYLAGAVNTVEKKYPELSPDQRARLRALFAPESTCTCTKTIND